MSTDREDTLHHKYDPLPDEPRRRKKRKKVHVKSDHKHDYEEVCIDDGSYVLAHGNRIPYYHLGKRCKVCGRLQKIRAMKAGTPPLDGMRRFKVGSFFDLFERYLPDEREVIA